MKSHYLKRIKEILENSEIHVWDDLYDFRTDDIFYFFQYPQHYIEYFGEREWRIFEKIYLSHKIKGKMNVSTRWKTLLPEHIKNKRILDLGSSLGVELYFIRKNLDPKFILGTEHSVPAIELARLAFQMWEMYNVNILPWDLINKLDTIPITDNSFDVTILSGSIFSFKFIEHLDFIYPYMKKLAEFISRVTTSYFYFIGVEKHHINPIISYFKNNKVVILDIKRTRMVKQFVKKEGPAPRNELVEFEYNTKRNEFYGYIEL